MKIWFLGFIVCLVLVPQYGRASQPPKRDLLAHINTAHYFEVSATIIATECQSKDDCTDVSYSLRTPDGKEIQCVSPQSLASGSEVVVISEKNRQCALLKVVKKPLWLTKTKSWITVKFVLIPTYYRKPSFPAAAYEQCSFGVADTPILLGRVGTAGFACTYDFVIALRAIYDKEKAR